jgi:hypothetical protein
MSHTSNALDTAEIPPQLVLRAALARDFCAFIEFSFGVLRPGTPFRPNWHIEAMAHKLAQIASGEVKRLIITLPPRNLKSICASVALPAWFLGHHPRKGRRRFLFRFARENPRQRFPQSRE